ncbi:MAG: 23S rRNA (guanosine(2251)-2'-O)-methyltransferase RlmB [Pseudohongiellaceae bacterium]
MKEWVIGIHAVSELLRQRPQEILSVVLQKGATNKRLEEIKSLARKTGVEMTESEKSRFDKQFKGVHQGVAAQIQSNNTSLDEKQLLEHLDRIEGDKLLLVLDGVTDPHNLGACLRTADAAGVHAVVVPKDRSAPLNETARKVASGAAETVAFAVVTNLARCLEALKQQGIWVVGTSDKSATSIHEQDLTGNLALVMGSEGSGLRRLTRDCCDHEISIPMAGELSSLNVSVATGVALFEAVRQRS